MTTIDNILDYVRQMLKQVNQPNQSENLTRQLDNAVRQQLFLRLNEIIQNSTKLSPQQKAEANTEMRRFQSLIDQYAKKEKTIKIKVNRALEELATKTFQLALEIQSVIQRLNPAGLCSGGDLKLAYTVKYSNLMKYYTLWDVLHQFESAAPSFNEDELRNLIQDASRLNQPEQHQSRESREVTKVIEKEKIVEKIVEVIKEVRVPYPQANNDAGLQLELDSLKLKYSALEKLTKAHEVAFGIYSEGDVNLGNEMYQQLGTVEANNAMAHLILQKKSPKGMETAAQYLALGVQQSHPTSIYLMGLLEFIHRKNHARGYDLLKKAAQAGNSDAKIDLATIYLNGFQGLTANIPEGIYYLQQCMQFGRAINLLALSAPNKQQAEANFLQAIKLGYKDAMYNLGRFYEQEKNLKQATYYFVMGMKEGDFKCSEAMLKYLYQDAIEKESLERFEQQVLQMAMNPPSGEMCYYLGLSSKRKAYFEIGAQLNHEECINQMNKF